MNDTARFLEALRGTIAIDHHRFTGSPLDAATLRPADLGNCCPKSGAYRTREPGRRMRLTNISVP